jgi:hypothetical protein
MVGAKLEQTFQREQAARDVAAGIEEESYPTEVINLNEEL